MEDTLLTITLPAHLPTKGYIDVFFERAVESLAKQTYKNFKLIIVLNGVWNYENSVKEIKRKISEEYQQRFLNEIELHAFEEKLGVSKATNYGLRKSSTKFLGFQAADDISFESRIEKQMNILLNNDKIDICGTGMIESGIERIPFLGSFDDFKKNMHSSPLIVGGSFVGKKDIFEKVNYFNEEHLTVGEDWDLWIRCAKAGANFYNINEPLCIWFHDYSTFKS